VLAEEAGNRLPLHVQPGHSVPPAVELLVRHPHGPRAAGCARRSPSGRSLPRICRSSARPLVRRRHRSDIDVFVVRPAGVAEDDPVAPASSSGLADHVHNWTGNPRSTVRGVSGRRAPAPPRAPPVVRGAAPRRDHTSACARRAARGRRSDEARRPHQPSRDCARTARAFALTNAQKVVGGRRGGAGEEGDSGPARSVGPRRIAVLFWESSATDAGVCAAARSRSRGGSTARQWLCSARSSREEIAPPRALMESLN